MHPKKEFPKLSFIFDFKGYVAPATSPSRKNKSLFNSKYINLLPHMGNTDNILEFLNNFEISVLCYTEINEA
jgi:hypothetical protein